jgi:hypothetical protein
MSYEIVVTYTKTADTPADAFKTMPVLKPDGDVTQEQIDALNATYPMMWDTKIVLDQIIMHNTFPSKEEYDIRDTDPIIKRLQAKRKAWAETNKLIVDRRVL